MKNKQSDNLAKIATLLKRRHGARDLTCYECGAPIKKADPLGMIYKDFDYRFICEKCWKKLELEEIP